MPARSIALTLLALIAALALAGICYQRIATGIEARRFPEPGKLVDIGGYGLKLNCAGRGTPTVVLESGLGDILEEWNLVQPEIAKTNRVCSYDRAGYGGSDAGPMPRTSAEEAEELRKLLASAGERPPYVLVGHSFGGYNVRVFNGKYPDEVVGLVLVDAPQEDQYQLLPRGWNVISAALLEHYKTLAKWSPVLIDMGITRAMLKLQGVHVSYLILQTKYLKARASELESIRLSAEQARAADHIRDKPLLVLTAAAFSDAILREGLTKPDLDAYRQAWIYNLQPRLAHLSAQGKQIIIPDSGHDIPHERPSAIVDAVRQIAR